MFEASCKCGFCPSENYITYDLYFIIDKVTNDSIEQYDEKYKPLFCLLHEIGHLVDWKCNNKQFKRDTEQMDWVLYHTDYTYAISLPTEKRANEFADREIKHWMRLLK